MKHTFAIRPPFSLLVICDPSAKVEVPEWKHGASLAASASCILCACHPEQDGPTQVIFGNRNEVQRSGPAVFQGTVKTPGCKIGVETAEGDKMFSMPTRGAETPVRI